MAVATQQRAGPCENTAWNAHIGRVLRELCALWDNPTEWEVRSECGVSTSRNIWVVIHLSSNLHSSCINRHCGGIFHSCYSYTKILAQTPTTSWLTPAQSIPAHRATRGNEVWLSSGCSTQQKIRTLCTHGNSNINNHHELGLHILTNHIKNKNPCALISSPSLLAWKQPPIVRYNVAWICQWGPWVLQEQTERNKYLESSSVNNTRIFTIVIYVHDSIPLLIL